MDSVPATVILIIVLLMFVGCLDKCSVAAPVRNVPLPALEPAGKEVPYPEDCSVSVVSFDRTNDGIMSARVVDDAKPADNLTRPHRPDARKSA